MAEFALRELIDEKRLQHLQNEFCKVTGVTAVCVDKEGRAITEPYIDKSLIRPDGEDPILGEYRRKAAQALDRVQEGSLEEQVVEELPDGGHVAAVAVSVENQIILYWQVYDLKKLFLPDSGSVAGYQCRYLQRPYVLFQRGSREQKEQICGGRDEPQSPYDRGYYGDRPAPGQR